MKHHLATLFSVLVLGMAAALAVAAGRPQAGSDVSTPANPDGNKPWETVRFLASDAFKSRRSGTPEYRKAAEWVAARFKELGLQPAGDKGTWFQEVEIKDFMDFVQPVRLEITSPQRRLYFAGRDRDFEPVRGSGSGIVKGKLAFAGYGVVSEKAGWNDYEGLDAHGRILMILPGVPA